MNSRKFALLSVRWHHAHMTSAELTRAEVNGLTVAYRYAGEWPPLIHRAHCLAGFLDLVGIERAQVLRLSWGGILAQEFYRLHPDRVLALILCDTYAGWKGSLPEAACKKRLERCFLESSLPSEEVVAQIVPEFFTEGAPAISKKRCRLWSPISTRSASA